MEQQTFAETSFEQYRKLTRREPFLDEMNRVVPWSDLVAVIEPVYPKAEGPGRPSVGIERMLRLHCLVGRTTLYANRTYLAAQGLQVRRGTIATAANVHDSQVLPRLLHGQERRVWGDAPTADNAT
jgi:hypothetical protein